MDTMLRMKNISKRFPGVRALTDVTFEVQKGEMHALVGQNGAGKSTLMKILAGHYRYDSGAIEVDGRRVAIGNTRAARGYGIAIVYQELSLLPNLTVAQNIFLGREPSRAGVINEREVVARANAILQQLGIRGIDVNAPVRGLTLAQQQLVEIAKALSFQPRILILDEPTAALADDDCQRLFAILRCLKEQGIAIIFISHRIREIMQNCDRGTILRNGRIVATVDINMTSEDELIKLMIGRELDEFYRHEGAIEKREEVLLEVDKLNIPGKIKDVSFEVRRGEIVGITGLLGSGQDEVARALYGLREKASGTIKINGGDVNINSPVQAIRLGLGLLTENRKEEELFPDMNVRENITLPSLPRFLLSRLLPFVDHKKEKAVASEFARRVGIVMYSLGQTVRTLSGGNQQKTILARCLLKNLQLFIFIEPTRGLDISARAEIYRYLNELCRIGKSVIIISTDSKEVTGVSDRILVMYKGQLVATFFRNEVSEETLLSAMQGGVNQRCI